MKVFQGCPLVMTKGEQEMQTLKLKMQTAQAYETHEDQMEEIIEAVVAVKGESTYITFKQEDTNFNTIITTLIKIKKGVVTVKRQGGIKNQMEFNVIKPYETLYATPMGEMSIRIETHEIENRVTEEAVHLKIRYSIFMQGNKTSENLYFIKNL